METQAIVLFIILSLFFLVTFYSMKRHPQKVRAALSALSYPIGLAIAALGLNWTVRSYLERAEPYFPNLTLLGLLMVLASIWLFMGFYYQTYLSLKTASRAGTAGYIVATSLLVGALTMVLVISSPD